MSDFRFYQPIVVRYGDLDPQGHVNNATYMTYLEQGRVSYIHELGLWDGQTFDDLGMILADIQLTYLAPIHFGQKLRIGVRVSRLGNKSLDMSYSLEDAQTHKELARGSTVVVTYDYRQRQSIPIPEVWRHAIATFEDIPPTDE